MPTLELELLIATVQKAVHVGQYARLIKDKVRPPAVHTDSKHRLMIGTQY